MRQAARIVPVLILLIVPAVWSRPQSAKQAVGNLPAAVLVSANAEWAVVRALFPGEAMKIPLRRIFPPRLPAPGRIVAPRAGLPRRLGQGGRRRLDPVRHRPIRPGPAHQSRHVRRIRRSHRARSRSSWPTGPSSTTSSSGWAIPTAPSGTMPPTSTCPGSPGKPPIEVVRRRLSPPTRTWIRPPSPVCGPSTARRPATGNRGPSPTSPPATASGVLILRGVTDLVNTGGGEAYGKIEVFQAASKAVMKRLFDSLPAWLALAGR